MKVSHFSFLLGLIFHCSGSFALVEGLLDHGKKMVTELEAARKCSVKKKKSGALSFCTGLELEKKDLKFLAELDLKACREFLGQMKFKTHVVKAGQSVKGVPQEDLDHFFSSTKLALILYHERIILFKREAKRGDCLHEIIHFYQRHRPSQNPLAPLRRKEAGRRLQFLLEKSVGEVEKLERAGKIEEAKKEASSLQPFIALQREWQGMIHWLDEKEVYQLFFDYGSLINTGERDYDVALSNLVRLKESLPWDLRERVLYEANRELNKKYQKVKAKKGTQSEAKLSELFNKGKISREEFEERVIALRKYQAQEDLKKARSLNKSHDILKARIRLRDFDKDDRLKGENLKEITLKSEKGLWYVELMGKKMVVDTGAQVSVLPLSLIEESSEKELLLLGAKALQNAYGQSVQAPLVVFKKELSLGGQKVTGLSGALAEMNLAGFDGVLGMDFFKTFNEGNWLLNTKEKTLSQGVLKGGSFALRENGLGEIDSLEFSCGDSFVRIDSGSQFFGELERRAKMPSCLRKAEQEKLVRLKEGNTVLFSREIEANLGVPYLKGFKTIGIDLKKKRIIFVRNKE